MNAYTNNRERGGRQVALLIAIVLHLAIAIALYLMAS
jgi:hypothetical protein